MTTPLHHIPDPLLRAYAAGTIAAPYANVIAAHISLCDTCRAAYEAHNAVGGSLLAETAPEPVSDDMKARLMAMLDAPDPTPPAPQRRGIFPAPVAALVPPQGPRWRSLGFGVKQSVLIDTAEGSLRLLYIPAGREMPNHSHSGLELTLVLQGSFSDDAGRYGVGDVDIGGPDMVHTPVADAGPDCICLAATDGPLKFQGLIPRLLQPVFGI